MHTFTGILPDKPHYLYFTVDLAPTSPAVVGNTKEDTAKAKQPEPELIPPTPLEQNNKTKGTKLPKHTQQTKLNATQSSVLKQLVTLEQSKLYHESKSKEFERHTKKHKQPDFTYPHTDISYTGDFSSENHEKYTELKRKFQIDMCELLAQHHKEKSEATSTEVESLLLRAEMAYKDTRELTLIEEQYKALAIEKFLRNKTNKNNKRRGAGGVNHTAENNNSKRQRR